MAVPLALRFFRGQVLPRMRRLIFSKVVGFSVVVSVGLGVALPVLPAGVLPISDVANVGITFASIAMGACIAAVVLSVGLPGPDRLRRWANLSGSVAGHSALSDLVFVLVWATLAQVALILVCVLSIAFGGTLPLAPVGMIPTHAAGLHVGLLVFFYALFELTVVVQTLSQMAAVVIVEEQLPSPGSPAIH